MNKTNLRWACVVRCGGIGDNLIASSVLPGLRQRYDRIEVISRAPGAAVFENNPFIDKLTIWPEEEPVTDALTWARRMGSYARNYAGYFHLSHSCEIALAFMEGQSAFWWPEKARRKMCDHSYLGYVHDICDLEHEFAPNFFPTEAEQDQAKDTIAKIKAVRDGPIVGWCLTGTRIDKIYPFAAMAISRLLSELNASVVMFGAPGRDFELARQIQIQVQQYSSDKGLHLALSNNLENPNWPIRRVLTQVQTCDVMVSPDTGPAWAVAMHDLPKVITLSHASPKNITHGWVNTTTLHADPERVSCWPCHRLQDVWETCRKAKDVQAAACISDIPVNAIIGAVCNGLNRVKESEHG